MAKTNSSAKIAKYAESLGLKVINTCCDTVAAYDQLKQQLKV